MPANTQYYHVSTVYDVIDHASSKFAAIQRQADFASHSAVGLRKTMAQKQFTGSSAFAAGQKNAAKFNQELERSKVQMDRAKHSAGQFKTAILGIGAAWAGGAMFQSAKRSLIDFNSNLQQNKVQMAGLLQLNTGGDFTTSMEKANTLVKQLQLDAQKSVGTTKDFVEMAARLARPITAAGLGMEELRSISHKATVAAKAMLGGDTWAIDVAALDIEQALSGTLTKRERFARSLLEPMGWTTSSFNELKAPQRAAALVSAFQQKALADMAKAQETSFAGVTSTFKDHLEMTLGKVGLPLMKSLTDEVLRWNKYIDTNAKTIENMASKFSRSLVEGFVTVKEVASFFLEHGNVLLSMAKALIAYKIGQVAGAGIGRAGHFLGAVAQGGNSLRTILKGPRVGASHELASPMSSLPAATFVVQHGTISMLSSPALSHRMGRSIGEGLGRSGGMDSFFRRTGIHSMSGATRTATSTLGSLSTAVGAAVPWIGALSFAIQGVVGLVENYKKGSQVQAKQRRDLTYITDRVGGAASTIRILKEENLKLREQVRQSELAKYTGSGPALSPLQQAFTDRDLLANSRKIQHMQGVISESMKDLVGVAEKYGFLTEELTLVSEKLVKKRAFYLQDKLDFVKEGQASRLINAIEQLRPLKPERIAQIIKGETANDLPEDPRDRTTEVKLAKSGVKVVIQKIEIAANDPDRFIQKLAKAIERLNRNPRQAKKAFRGGS